MKEVAEYGTTDVHEMIAVKELYKKGAIAFYHRGRNLVFLLRPEMSKKDLYSALWHENTHKAVIDVNMPQERIDEFYSLVNNDRREEFEHLSEGYYLPEERVEEFMACSIQALYELGRWDAKALSKMTKASVEDCEKQLEIVQPLIEYIRNGREKRQNGREGVYSTGSVSTDRNVRNNVLEANREETGIGETTGELTEDQITEMTLFRKAEQIGENEVVLTENAVTALGEKLNIPARVVNDVESLPENKRDKKGWVENGEVVVVLDKKMMYQYDLLMVC